MQTQYSFKIYTLCRISDDRLQESKRVSVTDSTNWDWYPTRFISTR